MKKANGLKYLNWYFVVKFEEENKIYTSFNIRIQDRKKEIYVENENNKEYFYKNEDDVKEMTEDDVKLIIPKIFTYKFAIK